MRDDRLLRVIFGVYLFLGALFVALILSLGGCRVDVTVEHKLRSPIRCRMDHRKHDLGFLCDHVERQGPELRPAPGTGVPPL